MDKMSISVGLHRGWPVTKRLRKRPTGHRVKPLRDLTHEVIREVCGYAPYERRVMELLRNGYDKRALRVCKRKLGTIRRAKRKREEMNAIMQKARLERMAHMEHHHHHEDAKKKKLAARKEKAKAKKAAEAAQKAQDAQQKAAPADAQKK